MKAWNFKLSEKAMAAVKTKAVRYLAWFLLLMCACTVVSRAADGMTVATVQTETPKRTNIGHNVSLSGTIVAAGEFPVMAESGMLVNAISVEKGDAVQEGDLLFTLDTAALEKKLEEKKEEVQRKKAEISASRKNTKLAEEEAGKQLQRLYEDYSLALAQAEAAIADAEQALRTAQGKANSYGMFLGPEEEYDYAQAAALDEDVKAKRKALEEAQQNRDDTIRKYEREIEDANAEEKADASATLQQMDYDALKEELKELTAMLERGGEVYATRAGIVTKVEIAVGKHTGNEAALYMADGEGMVFEGEITKEQAKYAAPGDKMQVTLPGSEKGMVLDVLSVEPLEEDAERYRVTAKLEPGKGTPGQAASAEISQRSKTYESCVPLSAVYQDNGQHYVMTVRETETALGKEYAAERVNVTVEDSNETYAAISGPILADTMVIISSSRTLQGGDRIRLGEGAG